MRLKKNGHLFTVEPMTSDEATRMEKLAEDGTPVSLVESRVATTSQPDQNCQQALKTPVINPMSAERPGANQYTHPSEMRPNGGAAG